MLGRGWQWVEETGNRARAGEYSTEKQGVGGRDGVKPGNQVTNVTSGAM